MTFAFRSTRKLLTACFGVFALETGLIAARVNHPSAL